MGKEFFIIRDLSTRGSLTKEIWREMGSLLLETSTPMLELSNRISSMAMES